MAADKRTILLVHVDRAPEFREVEFAAARYLLPGDTGWPGEVTYESLGKVAVGLEMDEDGLEPEAYALMRMFAHPDVIQAVKEKGDRHETTGV